jgi:hypothetical protein
MNPENMNLETLKTVKTIDDLFILWQEARPEYKDFSIDGILVEDSWKQANPKIAFLLKESNDGFVKIRGRSWGPQDNSGRFWRNLRMWTYITTECLNGRVCTFARTIAEKEKPLAEVAYINIKKKAESKSVSYDPDIHNYIASDLPFLKRQIEIIAPDILFCCGTFKYIRDKIELEGISKRIYSYQHLLVVDFYHPSFWGRKDESNFNLLHEMLNLIPEKYKQRSPTSIQL